YGVIIPILIDARDSQNLAKIAENQRAVSALRGGSGRKKSLQLDPHRRVVAGIWLATHRALDLRALQSLRKLRAQQNMVEPQAGIARKSVPHVVPERVDARVAM